MITIPLLILTGLYLWFGVWLCKKFSSWPGRIALTVLMSSPALYWIGSYQYVKYEHEQACARDGGLKVLIQPEKVGRIRLDPDSGWSAQDLLFQYSPRLEVVEAWDGEYDGSGTGGKTGHLFAYSPDPATSVLPKRNWKFNKVPLAEFTPGLYVLTEISKIESNLTTTTLQLTRNGQVYARWTKFHHYWTRNPGMPIGWQCFTSTSPESYDQFPHRVLTELILK